MEIPEVKAFNSELSGLYENKPPISKAKMSAITRGAIKAIKFYKHVVHSVEKFIQKCKPEYKVPGLYVIDSIVRQSRHQFGQDKDVFAPRFAKNMQQTFANLFRCPPEDKRNIIRVLNLWQKNNVFGSEVIQPLLDMADPNHPLHQEIQQQQNASANGSSLNMSSDNKSPATQSQTTPHSQSPMGDQFQDQSSQPSSMKFRKLLNDFEYESEDDTGNEPPPSQPPIQQAPVMPQNPAEALGSILTNPEIMRQLQSLQAQMQMMSGMQMQNFMPMMPPDMQMQQNQQPHPFMNNQMDSQKPPEMHNKEDMNESDIEFVETGPQVIEIPDHNDSRSPSPSRRRRSRSPRRRRRSRSRSPRRRRDRDKDRDRDRERDREKTHKDREADKEKQREREKKGLPPIKKEHLSVCSTTLWVGHVSKLATPEELWDIFGGCGDVVGVDVVSPRGCAYVTMDRRRDAHRAKEKLHRHKLHSKEITVAWAPGKGVKGREWKEYWETELGVSYLPWNKLHQLWALGALTVDGLEDGGAIDEDTLPPWLPPRILPKAIMENQMSMMGLPPVSGPGMMPNMPPGSMPNLPAGMTAPPNMSMPGGPPRMPLGMPPPGMVGGMNGPGLPHLPPGLPPNLANLANLPNLPNMASLANLPNMPNMSNVPNMPRLPSEGGLPPTNPMLGFPPGITPQTMANPGALGGFLTGVMGGVATLGPPHLQHSHITINLPQPATSTASVTRTDDAMDLDNEDNEDTLTQNDTGSALHSQILELVSKPPPESRSPSGVDTTVPPPRDDRDRRDRRSGADRGSGGDRGAGGRDRRGGRDAGRERERDDRRDRDRDRGGRDRRDRDRDRERDRDRPRDRDRSREKSPSVGQPQEKSLQERLWEMANGKPNNNDVDKSEQNDMNQFNNPPPQLSSDQRQDHPPSLMDTPPPDMKKSDSGWTQLPPQRMQPPPIIGPTFRAELRMRGPRAPPVRGPWEGPNFGPRFTGMGPPSFNRPPFDGPMFDGPRFERPPFNRMPFDGPNRPFDGQRPPFDGPRPPFDGLRPPFDGPRPPFDGPRPPFDGSRPPFDGPRPPFDGKRPFDGPRPNGPRSLLDDPIAPPFDGPQDFFDRNNRRYDDRERGWNGDRERDRDWDRREWDDRRRDRRREDDRFNRDRRDTGDRRRNYDDRRQDDRRDDDKRNESETREEKREEKREDRPKRDKDRKSRWGAAEEVTTETTADSNESKMETQNTDDSSQVQITEHNPREEISNETNTIYNNKANITPEVANYQESTNSNVDENKSIENCNENSYVEDTNVAENSYDYQSNDNSMNYTENEKSQQDYDEKSQGDSKLENTDYAEKTVCESNIENTDYAEKNICESNIENTDVNVRRSSFEMNNIESENSNTNQAISNSLYDDTEAIDTTSFNIKSDIPSDFTKDAITKPVEELPSDIFAETNQNVDEKMDDV